tara:strand:+ start:2309 stop:3091 length:783 start_codon:yes stop_codon:yes gene_type:complete
MSCTICTRHQHKADETECTPQCVVVPADRGVVCNGCHDRMRQGLDLIVETWALTDEPGFPTPGGEGRAKSRPLPGGDEWIDWRAEVPAKLASWCQDFAEFLDLHGPTAPHESAVLTAITGWLTAHLSSVSNRHPAVDDFATEVQELANRGTRLAGMTQEKKSRVPCPTDGCGFEMRIRASQLEEWTRCKRCGIERTSAQLLYIAARADAWVPLQVAVDVSGIPESTIKRAALADKIPREKGRYWLPSVMEFSDARKQRRA